MKMAESSQVGHRYSDVQNYGGQTHMGDVNNYGETSDERTFRAILESLSYPGMEDRRNSLVGAHEGTFEWTFLEGKTEFVTRRDFYEHSSEEYLETEKINMNFKTWLEAKDQGLFCILGKPGSGKSTFMKSLAAHHDLERILSTWADNKILIQADHYFWILGTSMLNSSEGLLRNLLHAILRGLSQPNVSANLEAIKHICESRWSSSNVGRPWSCAELKAMLSRISSVPNAKIFLIVDALDECEPQDTLHRLADDVLWISQLPSIKLCISCRPWKVFTRKFRSAPTIHLDRLTYHDMEIYVRDRLISAEAETVSGLGFCEHAPSTRRFVQRVVLSADGVFLWTELVLTAICSEIRKGKDLEQLNQAVSGFPNNLDDYFQRLIFDRIGKTRQNVLDTAAALKLALVIALDAASCWPQLPFAHSFCNFWLLSKGCLKSGFTWTDPIETAQSSQERMLRHTSDFLHEACKDLLIIRETSWAGVVVEFLHRTVLEFLCERGIFDFLEKHAPEHFSAQDFPSNLAKLRCICLLSSGHVTCQRSLSVLDEALRVRGRFQPPFDLDWFSTLESLTLKQLKGACNCFGLEHVPSWDFANRFIYTGRHQFLIESTAIMPHYVFVRRNRKLLSINMFENLLQAATEVDIRDSGVLMLCHLLERGCLSCSRVEEWPSQFAQNILWCERTCWEALLSGLYIESNRIGGVTENAEEEEDTQCESAALRMRRIVAIIELLLHHGADPSCRPCISDHKEHQVIGPDCRHVTLSRLLERIFPPEERFSLQRTLSEVETPPKQYVLRRNQHRRAMRSFMISETNFTTKLAKADESVEGRKRAWSAWQVQQDLFLTCMTTVPIFDVLHNHQCGLCCLDLDMSGLVAWCVDCQAVFCICTKCFQQSPSSWPPEEFPCETFTGMPSQDHTKIALAVGDDLTCCDGDDPLAYLKSEYSVAKAMDVLKEWYLRNPI